MTHYYAFPIKSVIGEADLIFNKLGYNYYLSSALISQV